MKFTTKKIHARDTRPCRKEESEIYGNCIVVRGFRKEKMIICSPTREPQNKSLGTLEKVYKYPPWKLTYPLLKAFLMMIFLFPRWDMLVPWRVLHFMDSDSAEELGGKETLLRENERDKDREKTREREREKDSSPSWRK